MPEFNQRRIALAKQLTDNQGAMVFAALPQHDARFLQNKNFYYLTGLQTPLAVLLVYKNNGQMIEKLFIERNIPERIVWDGKKPEPAEVAEVSGFELANISFLDEFDRVISGYCAAAEKLFLNFSPVDNNTPVDGVHLFAERARKRNPQLTFGHVNQLIRPLRNIKDEWEIAQLQTAIDVTGEGLMRIFENAKAGMMEYQLEAMLYHTMLDKGMRNWGFTPIIAQGVNATTLHYIENTTKIEDNNLVLCDVGAAYSNYSADITRTFPIAAKFSPRQLDVYQRVLDTQLEVIEMMKPGVSMPELNQKANQLLTEHLKALGLITDDKDLRKYYPHSIGHHLGLDTHDLGLRDSVLEIGNVITCEPGLYIPEEGIGIRIEDDIYVTETGPVVLSESIPKHPEDLEKIRQGALKK